MPIYMGIDESNHGNLPEVFVATISNSYRELSYHGFNFQKLRYKSNQYETRINHILKNTNFNFSIFPSHLKQLQSYFSVVFLYEALKNVKPKEVIFDGNDGIITKNLENLLKNLFDNNEGYKPKIILEPKADISYPLVNKADALSYHLYNIFRGIKPNKKVLQKRADVNSRLWTPDIVQIKNNLKLKI